MTIEYLSTKEVADILGVHPETVRVMIRRGKLPAYKPGHLRVCRKDLDEYIERSRLQGRRQKTQKLVTPEALL